MSARKKSPKSIAARRRRIVAPTTRPTPCATCPELQAAKKIRQADQPAGDAKKALRAAKAIRQEIK